MKKVRIRLCSMGVWKSKIKYWEILF